MSDGVKNASAAAAVSVEVSSAKVSVMAGPFVDVVVDVARLRVVAVGPADKRDKVQLLVALVRTAMTTATAMWGHPE